MPILEKKDLTEADQLMIAEVLKNPALKRYFEILAHNIAVDMAYCSIAFGEDPQKYIHKQQQVKGQLDLLDTLANATNLAAQFTQE